MILVLFALLSAVFCRASGALSKALFTCCLQPKSSSYRKQAQGGKNRSAEQTYCKNRSIVKDWKDINGHNLLQLASEFVSNWAKIDLFLCRLRLALFQFSYLWSFPVSDDNERMWFCWMEIVIFEVKLNFVSFDFTFPYLPTFFPLICETFLPTGTSAVTSLTR